MTGESNGAPNIMSYRDAVKTHLPPQRTTAPSVNVNRANLKAQLRNLLKRHPEGMLLTRLRRTCPLLFHSETLSSYASTTELLSSMGDVLRMQGVGVQTRIYPAGM